MDPRAISAITTAGTGDTSKLASPQRLARRERGRSAARRRTHSGPARDAGGRPFRERRTLLGPIDFANIRARLIRPTLIPEWFFDAFAANDIYYQRTVNDFGEAHYEPGDGPLSPPPDWVVTGGENGPRRRCCAWTRAIRDQCAAAGVAYFHKQNGEWIDADEHFGRTVEICGLPRRRRVAVRRRAR